MKLALGCDRSKAFGGTAASVIFASRLQVTNTSPKAGCAKLNVYVEEPLGVTAVAAISLIRKSDAFTPNTGSLNVTEICVRLVTLPGVGAIPVRVGETVSRSRVVTCASSKASL